MPGNSARCFEDLREGEWFRSPGRTVTEADVVNYAGLSGDYNILHTDEEFMRNSGFKTRIAHGLLGLAIQSGLAQRAMNPPVSTIAFLGIEQWKFRRAIHFGDTIWVKLTVYEKRETGRPDRGIVKWKRELFNQRDELVQEGITVSLVHRSDK